MRPTGSVPAVEGRHLVTRATGLRVVLLTCLLGASALTPVASASGAAAPRCAGRAATIVGTGGDDRIRGTHGDDVIVALAGRDRIDAGGGDDVVCGGPGGDVIRGDGGDDLLLGQGNQFTADPGGIHVVGDVLDGGRGDDVLDLGPAAHGDTLAGERVEFLTVDRAVTVDLAAGTARGQGDDVIRVVRGMSLRTGPGDDTILGTPGVDRVDPGPGNDTVSLFAGSDIVHARRTSLPDDDVVDTGTGGDAVALASGADRVSTGPGQDSVQVRGRGPHKLDTGAGADGVYVQVRRVTGSSYDLGEGEGDELSFDATRRVEGGLPTRIDVPAGLVTFGYPGATVETRIAGVTDFELGPQFRIDFQGGDAGETLFLAPVGSIGIRAVMGGGDDRVWGSRGDDYIDGGDGVDTAFGDEGDDTCVQVEDATDC